MKLPRWPRRKQRELEQEISAHLEMSARDCQDRGASHDESAHAARREFGNVALIEQITRDQSAWGWLDNLSQDFRFAARTLRKNPAFTIIAVLTLALGIGANTAIFSVVNAVILRPLPFSNSSRLIDIGGRSTLFDFEHLGISYPDITDLATDSTELAGVASYRYAAKEFFADGKPDRIVAADISENFFPLLGIEPLFGRSFTTADMQPGSRAVILGHKLWRDRFGGDPSAIGKTILLNGEAEGRIPTDDYMQATYQRHFSSGDLDRKSTRLNSSHSS